MNAEDMAALERAITEITAVARSFGLDMFPMRYEICPPDIIYTFGAYGMPTRFSHWSFGKAFQRMKMQYDLGLSKIYELVINSDPCYAFLMEGNTLIQNKLIVAHVLAHSDFFRNNARFSRTNRHMVETMSATARRIREYEMEYGVREVEPFIDAVLAIQEHIDPSLHNPPAKKGKTQANRRAEPEKDIVRFIAENASRLEAWQRDIMFMLREEMLYFWPQIETKIMNEGWATFWHMRIMRELDLTPEEAIEYSRMNAQVVQPAPNQINPYLLGCKIFEDIEKRWGRDFIFEVRELDSDVSFLRNYLTEPLVQQLDLYIFEKQGQTWKIADTRWEQVRNQLVESRVNGGYPYITVKDGDYRGHGELYLLHHYEGVELDLKYLEKTLPHVYRLWGKPVHLETVVESRRALFSYDGAKHARQFL